VLIELVGLNRDIEEEREGVVGMEETDVRRLEEAVVDGREADEGR
jgi:hypothetical protein